MAKLIGFGRLQSVDDLLGKLRFDYSRMEESPGNEYAAFDFFVTAEHMIDWRWSGHANRQRREQFRASSPLLEVVSHIASGVKHFVAGAQHHQSVSHADVAFAAFDPEVFDGNAFQTSDELFVTLEGSAEVAFGTKVGALELASKVLAYWEGELRPYRPGRPVPFPKQGRIRLERPEDDGLSIHTLRRRRCGRAEGRAPRLTDPRAEWRQQCPRAAVASESEWMPTSKGGSQTQC